MTASARGTFEVQITPQARDDADPRLGRMSLAKTFSGDLVATSRGEMLSAGNPASGSAGYVAIEVVEGRLHGRSGSFALQHHGTLTRGEPELSVKVVPGSGTDELEGLGGRMTITADGKSHAYSFDYTLPGAD